MPGLFSALTNCDLRGWHCGSSPSSISIVKSGIAVDAACCLSHRWLARSSISNYSSLHLLLLQRLPLNLKHGSAPSVTMDCANWTACSGSSVCCAAGAAAGFWTCRWRPRRAGDSCQSEVGVEQDEGDGQRESNRRRSCEHVFERIVSSERAGWNLLLELLGYAARSLRYLHLLLSHLAGPSTTPAALQMLCSIAPCPLLCSGCYPCLRPCWTSSPD